MKGWPIVTLILQNGNGILQYPVIFLVPVIPIGSIGAFDFKAR